MPFESSMPFLSPSFSVVLVIAFAVFWIMQFAKLMALDADCFPAQHDRYGWLAAFVLLWFLAPLAFFLWDRRRPRKSKRSS